VYIVGVLVSKAGSNTTREKETRCYAQYARTKRKLVQYWSLADYAVYIIIS